MAKSFQEEQARRAKQYQDELELNRAIAAAIFNRFKNDPEGGTYSPYHPPLPNGQRPISYEQAFEDGTMRIRLDDGSNLLIFVEPEEFSWLEGSASLRGYND